MREQEQFPLEKEMYRKLKVPFYDFDQVNYSILFCEST